MTNVLVALIIAALFSLGIWLGFRDAAARQRPEPRIYVSPEELDIP